MEKIGRREKIYIFSKMIILAASKIETQLYTFLKSRSLEPPKCFVAAANKTERDKKTVVGPGGSARK